MSEPHDSSVMYEDATALIQRQYLDQFTDEFPGYFDSPTNKMISAYPEVAGYRGLEIQYKLGPADSVRWSRNPLAENPAPQNLSAGTLTYRFSERDTAANDFTHINCSVRVSEYTRQRHKKFSPIDLAKELFDGVMKDYDEKLAIMRQSPSSGRLALVNGTPARNNHRVWASATATASNTNGLRIKVDNGSISNFRTNARYDFINPSTGAVNAGNIRCTDTNVVDLSVGFEYISSGITGALSTGNLANVADNDIIVFSGTYNVSFNGFGAYFTVPASSGDSFIGGVDRNNKDYRWMVPLTIREGASDTPRISRSHFDLVADAMSHLTNQMVNGVSVVSHPTLNRALRNEIGEAGFINIPEGDSRLARFGNFGSMGLNYQDSSFGTLKLITDALMPTNTVRFLMGETWKTCFVFKKGLQPKKVDGGNHWYNLDNPTPKNGKSLEMQADWFANQGDWCDKPWMNAQIVNVSATG